MSVAIRPVFSAYVSGQAIKRFRETVADIPEYKISQNLEDIRINIPDYAVDFPAHTLREELDRRVSIERSESRRGYLVLVLVDVALSGVLHLSLLATAPYWACKTLDVVCSAVEPREPRRARPSIVACTGREDLARQILGRVFGMSNPGFWDFSEDPDVCAHDMRFMSMTSAMEHTLVAIEKLNLNPRASCNDELFEQVLVGGDELSIWPTSEDIDPNVCDLLLKYFPSVDLHITCEDCGERLGRVTRSCRDGDSWKCRFCAVHACSNPSDSFKAYLKRELCFDDDLLSRIRIDVGSSWEPGRTDRANNEHLYSVYLESIPDTTLPLNNFERLLFDIELQVHDESDEYEEGWECAYELRYIDTEPDVRGAPDGITEKLRAAIVAWYGLRR